MEKLSPTGRRGSMNQTDLDKDFNVRSVQQSKSGFAEYKDTVEYVDKKTNEKSIIPMMPRLDRDLD